MSNISKPPPAHLADAQKRKFFERLKEKVLIKRPVLKSILEKNGDKPLLEYAKDYTDVNLNPTIPQRQNEMLKVIWDVTEQRFGTAIADSVIRQLEHYYFVSTADHVGPISDPFFVNSNLLIASSLFSNSDPILQNVIVLACANISVDNSSFPRGLQFHNKIGDTLCAHRLAFLSSNERPPSIYTMRPYTIADLEKIFHSLKVKRDKNEITEMENIKVRQLLEEIYNTPEALGCGNYTEQISRTNFRLWKKFFNASKVRMPNLIYLEVEDIVIKLIIKYHLYQDTIINQILFNPLYEPYINDYFEGIFGSFSRKDSEGTYLFWALPKGSRYNLQLWKKGNYLVSKDGSYKIELHPETIKKAMESKELIPSLLLNYMVVSFYYGLKCLGGFNQVNYLTLMKNAYIKMNVELGNYRSIEVCARAQTKEMCDGFTVAFLGYGKGNIALSTGLDLILYDQPDSLNKMMDICKNVTVNESIDPLLPEIYKISYDQKEWDDELISVTEKDIMHLSQLDKKITPCISI